MMTFREFVCREVRYFLVEEQFVNYMEDVMSFYDIHWKYVSWIFYKNDLVKIYEIYSAGNLKPTMKLLDDELNRQRKLSKYEKR